MKTLTWLVAILSLAACGPDVDLTGADIFGEGGGDVWTAKTTIEGRVLLGSQPMIGYQARLQIFRDAAGVHPVGDVVDFDVSSRTSVDKKGRYSYQLLSWSFCPQLLDGLWIHVSYRQAYTDPFTPSGMIPWVIREYSACEGATLHAEDIVIPLPEHQPTG